MTYPLTIDTRALRTIQAGVRRLPYDLRRELRGSVAREVATPVARQVSLAAGASGNPFARAFRSQGVAVKPSTDTPEIVVGGPAPFGGHRGTMRKIAGGAEFGGSRKHTTYTRKRSRGGRRRGGSGTVIVRRATTVGFGRAPGGEGRFVFPTFRRELPRMGAAYLVILGRIADRLGGA
jgi:hypothetical protein